MSRPGDVRGSALQEGRGRPEAPCTAARRFQSWTAAPGFPRSTHSSHGQLVRRTTAPTRKGEPAMARPARQYPGASGVTRYASVPAAGPGWAADIVELITADHRRIERLCRTLYDTARY